MMIISRILQQAEQYIYDVAPSQVLWIVVLGALLMICMGFMIGANDMANVLATSIGSKALKLWQASLLGAIFVTIGATFLGSKTSSAIRSNIVNIEIFEDTPTVLMFGMLCSLIGASSWLYIATRCEWPCSTTHSIVGAIIGFGLALGNVYESDSVIDWPGVINIILSWIASPILTGILSAIFYNIVKYLFLKPKNSEVLSQRFLFVLLFALSVIFIVSIMNDTSLTFPFACVQEIGAEAESPCVVDDWFWANVGIATGIAIGVSVLISIIGYLAMYRWLKKVLKEDIVKTIETTDSEILVDHTPKDKVLVKNLFVDVHGTSYLENKKALEMKKNLQEFSPKTEKYFTVLQVLSACFDTLSLGASDIANATGPFATIWAIYNDGYISSKVETPTLMLFLGGLTIALGIVVMGYHVVKTLGIKLIAVTPSRGFCIEMSSSLILLMFANVGVPLSSTHCQVGATVGLGMCEPRDPQNKSILHKIFGSSVNWKLMGLIFLSWVLTLIVAGGITACLFSFGVYAPTVLTI